MLPYWCWALRNHWLSSQDGMCWSSFSFSMSRSVVTLYVTLYYTAWLYTDHFYNSCAMLEQTNRVQLEASACLFWRFQSSSCWKVSWSISSRLGVLVIKNHVSWFLEQLMLNSDVSFSFFSRQPAAIRSLKLYLTRILTVNSVVGSTDTFNPMDMFDDKVSVWVI